MKPYTQLFANCANRRQAKIYNISRTLNATADALARPVNVPTNASFENICAPIAIMITSALCKHILCKAACSFLLLI
jgi:hypothetical protein